ncbi:uncharacterized protein LOC143175075 isoform X5 [Nomia melanderi]|uniref:uncharacterized protein LOC143175075 isoform X5 n=1 Tax=Nomia melanderi TaxID=2448451 RepID=UPI003FCD29B4
MDVFQKNYRAYCSVMYITGLWPYDNSIVTKIQRVLFCVLTLSSMVIQVLKTMHFSGVDDKNGRNHGGERTCAVVVLVTHTIVFLAIRWLPLQLSNIKIWVRKHTKRLHASERYNRSGFVNERNRTIEARAPDTNSYRMENAINRSAKSDTPIEIDVQSAVEMHQRALDLNEQLISNMMLSYLAAILAVVISFAVNLYRVYLVLQNKHEIDNVVITLLIFSMHVMVMLLNNYSGQRLINNSVDFFHNIYDTLWYCMPLRSQKLLLFIMMRSISEVKFNLAGLFTPCYEGFTTMMSSSFSYFTVITSV